FPSSTALLSRRSRKGETGQAMGVQQAFGGVARLVGPLWSTWVFGYNLHYPFWIASLFMAFGCLLTLRLRRERPAKAPPEPTLADAALPANDPAPIAPR
ncbi:MAG TPA: MFS transporter, partial [Thermoanaerobaculia bacterium]